jgi:superfamily II DNA/RNA helicase
MVKNQWQKRLFAVSQLVSFYNWHRIATALSYKFILRDIMSFKQFDFNPKIDAGIRACNYETPTPIQEKAIPAILDGRDILGLAQTGTGKTAAFVLPILQRMLQVNLQSRSTVTLPSWLARQEFAVWQYTAESASCPRLKRSGPVLRS